MKYLAMMNHPTAIYSVLAWVAFVLAGVAFLQRLAFKALERHLLAKLAESEKAIESLRTDLAKVGGEVDELEHAATAAVQGPVPQAGMNLNKRAHALRMHRRGEGVQQISTALNIPGQEVELLLKVQRILVANL
jgi:hypothetical protein